MADALDSKSGVPSTCGFKSHLRYHSFIRNLAKRNGLQKCILGLPRGVESHVADELFAASVKKLQK